MAGKKLLHESPGGGFCSVFIRTSKEFIQRGKLGTMMLRIKYTKKTNVFSKAQMKQ